ncbi:MAG: ornithine carbamoyltransferase [Alphaproteobacteria bacterium]|jgi:ornithine carbamoyltransferase
MTAVKHFLDIDALDTATLRGILDDAHDLKVRWKAGDRPKPCTDLVLATIFEKPSTRTRISYDLAMRQLGGETINLSPGDMQLGRGESIGDTAGVLSRYVDAIMIRTVDHQKMLDLAHYGTVPIINGLTDRTHPSQLMADVMTVEEHLGPIQGKSVAWAGDGNNMACSWIHAAVRFDFELKIACPPKYHPPRDVMEWAKEHQGKVRIVETVEQAVEAVDCVVTDTWKSMSDERAESEAIDMTALEPYRIDAQKMALANPDAIFMHCMPIYRGNEVSAQVADGPQSVVFDEAENRLHAQKAILKWCLT